MPPDLPRLPRQQRRKTPEANSATYAAMIGLCILGLGFLGMASLVLPQVGGLILVLLGGIAFFAIHYLVWGRLLTKLRDESRDQQRDEDL